MKILRRVLLGLGMAVLVLAGAGYLRFRALQGDYSQAVSIKTTREYQDPALLAKAFALPVAASYQREGVVWQRNPSFCGPTSAVNVMRSLNEPASQKTILEGTRFHTIFGLLPGGMTLDELGELIRQKSGRHVTVLRDLKLTGFREVVARANDPARRIVVNFHRGPLFATGAGHFSPIAGYLAGEDLVLVLDVNQHYQPWLVKTNRLFEAVDTLDQSSGRMRGLLVVE